MLQQVHLAPQSIQSYERVVGRQTVEELRERAAPLRGLRIAHINATSYGGGVSEFLRSLIPLNRSLGIEADWLVIPGSPEFFEITKGFHNALQGAGFDPTDAAKETYLRQNELVADALAETYDVVMVHDPQPLAARRFQVESDARWVWRCHIDTSEPNLAVLGFLVPFIREYDALVFTLEQFVPPGLEDRQVVVVPVSIDPLSPKNMSLPRQVSSEIVGWTGVTLDRPLITRISRCDPWKDPLGVIEV